MDRSDFYFLQLLTQGELEGEFDNAELADQNIVADLGLVGVVQSLTVTEHNPTADLTVDVSSGTAHDPNGQRIRVPSLQVVDMSVDYLSQSTAVTGGGNTNILALFLFFDRVLSDPRIDGNSQTVYFQRDESFDFKIVQSGESVSPSPPTLESDKTLLADIALSFGTTQIIDAIISTFRREDAFKLSAGAISVETGTPEESDQAILTELNNHVTGVANIHPATSIDYAGGSAWHDGTTNPADDVETTLDNTFALLAGTATGAASKGGADSIGAAALTAWRGGRTRPVGSIYDQMEAVGVDISAQSAGDDGAERVGAEAHTADGDGLIDLALGDVRDQLNALSNAAAAHGLSQNVAGDWTFAGELRLGALAVKQSRVERIAVVAADFDIRTNPLETTILDTSGATGNRTGTVKVTGNEIDGEVIRVVFRPQGGTFNVSIHSAGGAANPIYNEDPTPTVAPDWVDLSFNNATGEWEVDAHAHAS